MPRTKGSKNNPKTVTADFATQIAEKQSERKVLSAEIATITANLDSLKADLKEKKAELKSIDKEIVKLEVKRKRKMPRPQRKQKNRSGICSEKAACRRHECR